LEQSIFFSDIIRNIYIELKKIVGTMNKRIIALSINNPIDYNLISNLLKNEGHQSERLTVENMDELIKKVDVILVDEVSNPKIYSNLEAIKNMKSNYIPILVLLSGNSPHHYWLNKGFDDIIRMPISKTELILRINTFLKIHTLTKQIIINSEQKYRTVFESTGNATMIIDEDTTILLANKECEVIFGYSVNYLIGKSWTKFVYKEDLDKMIKRHYARRNDHDFVNEKYETRIIASSGEIKNIILSASMIPNSKQSVVSMLDITYRKKAEEELKKSEERFHSLYNNLTLGIYRTTPDGNILLANKALIKMLGFDSFEDLAKRNLEKDGFEKPELRKKFIELIERDGQTLGFESVWKRKNGSSFYVRENASAIRDSKGKILYYDGTVEDITERRQAELIQKTLLKISSLMNSVEKIEDFYYEIRNSLGNVIDTTNFLIALYDEKEDTLSLPFNINKKDKFKKFPAGKSIIKYVIETGKPLFATEDVIKDLVRKELIEVIGAPSKIWIGVPLKIKNKILGVIAVQSYSNPNLYTEKDIKILSFVSEEIALAIQHKKAEEEIKENLKEKEMLLRELYHRTKNNMQVISSMLRIKARDIQDKDLLNSFQEIEMKIRSMALVHQKLYESQNLSSLNLRSYFNDLISLIRRSFIAQSNNNIYLEAQEDIPVLIDTAIPLGLVLNELLTNSIKYAFPSNSKGDIQVVLYKEKDNKLIIKVSDNGVGCPKDFDINRDANLGLKTVINLIEMQIGGKIDFSFENGFSTKIEIAKEVYNVRI